MNQLGRLPEMPVLCPVKNDITMKKQRSPRAHWPALHVVTYRFPPGHISGMTLLLVAIHERGAN